MSRRVVTTRRADEDVVAAIDYYVSKGADDAAHKFVEALAEMTTLLSNHPSIGHSRYAVETEIPDLQHIALKRFPYVLFYNDDHDAVRIHRVLSTDRDIPGELANL